MLKRQLHGACRAFAIRWWSRHMISIGRKTVSYNFTVHLRATRFGMLQFLHDHNSCALAHDETVAVAIERPGSTLRFIVACAERFHCWESAQTDLDNRSLRASSK